ncbi:cytochrome c oxidase subunit 3 family protein [Sphingobium sp. 15-1]|uniref:cytochrome c oxidase subunit 3 family protein n=1 Tax=Sphingobium sp. 15-1 TaxID=2729616 RepID=UPI00159C7CA1|nr:cytochrome c oxidase subunit 3 family protein [Sphingobium sp. 15-1]
MNDSAFHSLKRNNHSHLRLPGEPGIWVFIFGDLLIFSLFFGTFLFYRAEDVAQFTSSQAMLSKSFGVFNTALMLSSSWFVAMGVNAVKENRVKVPTALFSLAFLCGAGFGVVKVFEYSEKISLGITLNTTEFYMYYYMFTGIHMVHVIIGMGVLAFLAFSCNARKGVYAEKDIRNIESGACFWHVVDLLWIVLFPILYMVK